LLCSLSLIAQTDVESPPRTWVDKDTGHRVWRMTDEPNSGGFYFNINAFTPDSRSMIYTAPDGIHVLDLASRKTRLLVPNPQKAPASQALDSSQTFSGAPRAIVVGHRTNSVFFTTLSADTIITTVYKANVNTGAITKLAVLPPHANISTVNSDETLAAGTYIEGGAGNKEYGAQARTANPGQEGPHFQPLNKGEMMRERLAARLPLVLFTVRLEPGPKGQGSGTMTTLLHSRDWVNHLLFSPVDPELLMYCHEGGWEKVDRIWMIHTDGTHNTLIHKRTMLEEIAGHEFWGLDGESIWYDWQYPKGQVFFLAGYNLKTKERTAYNMDRNAWSIHFNLTKDLDLFTGDGGDSVHVAHGDDDEWIELFHPETIKVMDGALGDADAWHPGIFHAEHLVNMEHHDYREEPNVRFSPDKSIVFFTSNLFGDSYVFGVETQKAVNPSEEEVFNTTELARKWKPASPEHGK
jgi:oligogalacturonide lyase